MFQSRDEIRQVYLNVWQKMQSQALLEPMEAIISDVIKLHSEYHGLLAQGIDAKQQEFTPEQGKTNPFLHMGMHIALREQLDTDRPTGIRSLHRKLSSRRGLHDAEHAMIDCMGETLWRAQRDNTNPDDQAYLTCLKKL